MYYLGFSGMSLPERQTPKMERLERQTGKCGLESSMDGRAS